MLKKSRRVILSLLVAVGLPLTIISPVFAHVVVSPFAVQTSSDNVFTMGVPSEKITATTSIKLMVPDDLTNVTPTLKQGWTVTTEKQGDAGKVTAIIWKGGQIPAGFRDEFTFSARTPAKVTELEWKAYQTYENGDVVSWDQPYSASDNSMGTSENKGPFSLTKVGGSSTTLGNTTDEASPGNMWAIYVAFSGVVLSLAAILIALRSHKVVSAKSKTSRRK